MDKILLEKLKLSTIIGVFPEERQKKQELIVDITLFCELRKAGLSDDLNDTIDYFDLEKKIIKYANSAECQLLESFAENLSMICLENKNITKCIIKVNKPNAPTLSNINIEVTRKIQ